MDNAQLFNEKEPHHSTTITTRVPLHLKKKWQQAAVLRGLSLTERDSLLLEEMLTRPPKINERLQKAISEELKQMESQDAV